MSLSAVYPRKFSLDLGLKSHPKDWRSLESNPPPLVNKASGLTTNYITEASSFFICHVIKLYSHIIFFPQLIENIKICISTEETTGASCSKSGFKINDISL